MTVQPRTGAARIASAGVTHSGRRMSATLRNLIVDVMIFAGFLLVSAPRFTGMTLHEWIGIAFGAAIVTHLLLHWQWLTAVTKRFFRHMPAGTRANYILNSALFVDVTIIIFTGLLISRSALPFFGITLESSHAWKSLHALSANLSLFLIGLHVALHWKWIANAARTYLLRPLVSPFARLAPTSRGTMQPHVTTPAGSSAQEVQP